MVDYLSMRVPDELKKLLFLYAERNKYFHPLREPFQTISNQLTSQGKVRKLLEYLKWRPLEESMDLLERCLKNFPPPSSDRALLLSIIKQGMLS